MSQTDPTSFTRVLCALSALTLWGVAEARAQSFARSYALVVGIDEYPSSSRLGDLEYATKDARAIADYLDGQGFVVETLYNAEATREAIVAGLHGLARRLRTNDRVLFFYAGHGYSETLGGSDWGYLVPYDGTDDSASYLPMDQLQNLAARMGTARHLLFIMDACFSGLFGVRSVRLDISVPNYIEQVSGRIARQALTAGDSRQAVLDVGPFGHSLFTGYLLRGLRDGAADLNLDGFITLSELMSFLVPAATSPYQTPAQYDLPAHEGGEFIFSTTGPLPSTRTPPSPPPPLRPPAPFRVVDRIEAHMSNVDDVGLVVIMTDAGSETVLRCEWSPGGVYGARSGSLGEHLVAGDNYIVFVLYNKVYASRIALFSGGKWSYNFRLDKNGVEFWQKSRRVPENDAALKYWKAIRASVDRHGRVSLSQEIPDGARRAIEAEIERLEAELHASTSVATPF